MDLKIIWVGKTRNPQLKELSIDYLDRTRHWVPCRVVEIRDFSKGRRLSRESLLSAEGLEIDKYLGRGRVVVLHVEGRELTSSDFARWIESEQNRGTREISFVIGGPEGVSQGLSERADLKLSLGRMTWTHEIARVLLLEQIYRAFSILRNAPYHK